MTRQTTYIILLGVFLAVITSFYYFPLTMPFGMMNGDTEEMKNVSEHSDNLESYEISPGATVERIQSGDDVVLLDVRTLEEYTDIHLKGALLLPVQEISQQSLTAIGLGVDAKNKEIIIYCHSGARSQIAYNVMKSLGYTNIKSVAGGMIHWQEDKYPLTETGSYTGPLTTSDTTEQAINKDGAKITFNKTSYDFGVIPQYGGTVQTDFTVTNEGTKTLEIGDITTSCSCTSATIKDTTIEVGETTVLTVVFDPDFHAEPLDVFKRTIFIPTNDPNTPEAEVSVTVDIAEGE